ncbi:MAG TPA: hypothetical protein VD864_11510 [Nocardioides sp.]|nr:hypothetical protein [Nocardioides sp.]
MSLTSRRVVLVGGIVLVGLAILTSAVLGTLGWFAVGFGVMTDCTNQYSCSDTGCGPCDRAEAWLGAGAALQMVLVVTGTLILLRGVLGRRPALLTTAGAILLAVSVLTIVATTSGARASY